MNRRRALAQLGTLGIAGAVLPRAFAQTGFPNRPVRIIVPFPPGQATDTFARMLAEKLTPVWGQNVVVENRGGGGGVPGTEAGRLAAPDGHTLLMGTSGTLGINPVVYSKLSYNPQTDFAPVTNVVVAPLVVVAHPSLPVNTMPELIAYVRRNPGKLNYGSGGPGTSQHMAAELLKARARLFMVHIPYRGSAPAMTDLLGGQIPLMVDSLTSALPHIKAGKLKAFAVTTAQRVPFAPELPAISEFIPGFEAVGWAGLVMPKATPPELVTKISADVQKILNDPAVREEIARRGSVADPTTPEQFAAYIKAENAKWGEVAKIANVKLD